MASSAPLPVTKLTVGLDDLKTSGDANEAHARAVDATAYLSYENLTEALGAEISQEGGPGRVSVEIDFPLAGEVAVSTTVSAAFSNRIAFTEFRGAQGQLPAPVRTLLETIFAEPIPLRNIPEGLRLRSVTPTADGLDAHFTGQAVTFRPDPSSA
ncbi:LmeA family phospholipid-binding protein [Streptomyces bobili]|uniref:LmeA family phospholipid-binding protein n=1 Tax=Streptomyces bobili TaxID=67280 RepID=UPI003713721F